MVYESDFYTTRRPYSRPALSSYSVSARPQPVPWDKVPFVPRPSLVADPITAFSKRKPRQEEIRKKESIVSKINSAGIKPSQAVLSSPIKEYESPRDQTRRKVLESVRKQEAYLNQGGITPLTTSRDDMDLLLPRLHRSHGSQRPDRKIILTTFHRRY